MIFIHAINTEIQMILRISKPAETKTEMKQNFKITYKENHPNNKRSIEPGSKLSCEIVE